MSTDLVGNRNAGQWVGSHIQIIADGDNVHILAPFVLWGVQNVTVNRSELAQLVAILAGELASPSGGVKE